MGYKSERGTAHSCARVISCVSLRVCAQVSTVELAEVHAVNALAPFILLSKLSPLLFSKPREQPAYVINVSSMEGKFERFKQATHPHTNMAKAALNMLTRTSAPQYAEQNVRWCCV